MGALDWKTTKRPSRGRLGSVETEPRGGSWPNVRTEARAVFPVWRSWTKTSKARIVSPGTRLPASDEKAMKRLAAAP